MTRLADIAPRRCWGCLLSWAETENHAQDECPFCGSARPPILFLDVDGVLNCVGRDEWGQLAEYAPGRRFPVYPPPGTADRVRRLTLEAFEPVWATAWLGSAHRCWSRVLNLDPMPWPYVDYERFKLVEIVRYARGRPWAWVDDDARWEMRELGWTDEMVPGLVLAPDPAEGLTDEHVERLLTWAAEVPA